MPLMSVIADNLCFWISKVKSVITDMKAIMSVITEFSSRASKTKRGASVEHRADCAANSRLIRGEPIRRPCQAELVAQRPTPIARLRDPSPLQFRHDLLGEIQPVFRQHRKHQIEAIASAAFE